MSKNIFVERETYTKNGVTRFTYFIRGFVRGKEVKVAVVPQDIGGYAVLDIVFGELMQADLVVTPFSIKNDAGEVITGNTYLARSIGEDGEVYECKIKPSRPSDKQLLNMILR